VEGEEEEERIRLVSSVKGVIGLLLTYYYVFLACKNVQTEKDEWRLCYDAEGYC
jgi:hypothetical protein